jgi:hypothetical protein
MGQIVLVVAIGVGLAGVAAVALSEAGAISSDTSADIVVVSLAATVAIVVVGFVLRRRFRVARDGMFVGLATLGAWFLLLMYALAQDTP